MSGYVASARIGGRAPRLVRRDERADDGLEPDDADGLAGRMVAIRERWTQLTFYLFDANSWP